MKKMVETESYSALYTLLLPLSFLILCPLHIFLGQTQGSKVRSTNSTTLTHSGAGDLAVLQMAFFLKLDWPEPVSSDKSCIIVKVLSDTCQEYTELW